MLIFEVEQPPAYIYRPILNGDEIREWAMSVGFKTTLYPNSFHVSMLESTRPYLGELKTNPITIPLKNQAFLEKLGTAWVVTFRSKELLDEYFWYKQQGAKSMHQKFISHFTISYTRAQNRKLKVGPLGDLLTFDIHLGPPKQTVWKRLPRPIPEI